MNSLFDTYGDAMLDAFWVTIRLTFWSAIGATVWGTILAGMRVSPVPVLRFAGTWYVNLFRNTPLTLIIVFCSVGLYQNLGIHFTSESSPTFIRDNGFWLAVLGFILYTSAFVCESLRSGINTVPLGQAEAARSLGLGFRQTLTLVVLPQAFRSVIAPLGSVLIALVKNTTIASAIGVAEAALLMKEMIENESDQLFSVFGIFAVGFMILTLPIGFVFGYASKKLAVKR
ncbi:amino acid ABC transporter permease [Tomitella gaofuii]|uniref:amino acid ABC transporter permease n=1 Tax=Tomitella gaofuii TaxID=2760083 RepID=UPI0015F8BC95|nr:amino acid ABC transporter permease [Tomitella gaofuii]